MPFSYSWCDSGMFIFVFGPGGHIFETFIFRVLVGKCAGGGRAGRSKIGPVLIKDKLNLECYSLRIAVESAREYLETR